MAGPCAGFEETDYRAGNLEILQVVRGVAVSPEELRGLLDMIRMVKLPQNGASATLENRDKEEI